MKLDFRIRFVLVLGLSSNIIFANSENPSTVSIETSSTAISSNELKTYNGPFTINNIKGNATYQYKDAPDGTRIFHGNFHFEGIDDYSSTPLEVNGNFKDNHQVGVWNWEGGWYLGFHKNKQNFSFTFNEDGILDGKAIYNGGNYDKYEFIIKDDRIEGSVPIISGNGREILEVIWENGHLVDKYKRTELNHYHHDDDFNASDIFKITEGQFDKDGIPCGEWIVQYLNQGIDNKICHYILDSTGKTVDGYYIESSTGDKIDCSDSFYKVEFVPALFRNKESFLLRDSKNKKGNQKYYTGEIFLAPDEPAEFPEGTEALMKWISKNIQYPQTALFNDIQGRVIVKMLVEKDGSISKAEIQKGVDHDLDSEAIRLVMNMPQWLPAKNNGKAVRSYYNVPIVFRLPY